MSANFIIYDIDTEEPRMVVIDAANPDDPEWLNINNAPEKHVMLPVDPEKYAAMSPEDFDAFKQKYIPIHKEWLLSKGADKQKAAVAFAEFEAHVAVIESVNAVAEEVIDP